jgi:hypothetical protein
MKPAVRKEEGKRGERGDVRPIERVTYDCPYIRNTLAQVLMHLPLLFLNPFGQHYYLLFLRP